MALQGTIDSFPVVDVLGLLANSAKTGCLELAGDRGRSQVWIANGRIVAGVVEDHRTTAAADVVFELLLNESGSFEFDSDARADEEDLDADVGETVAEASAMLEQWSEVRQLVPDTAMGISLSEELDSAEVTLERSEWQLVAAVATSAVVADLVAGLGISEFEGCRRLAGLVGRGLVVLGEPAPAESVTPDEVVGPTEQRSPDAFAGADATREPAGHEPQEPDHGDSTAPDAHHTDSGIGWRVGTEDDGSGAGTGSAAGDDGFPDHFPIDDLVGSGEAVAFGSATTGEPPDDSGHLGSPAPAGGFDAPANPAGGFGAPANPAGGFGAPAFSDAAFGGAAEPGVASADASGDSAAHIGEPAEPAMDSSAGAAHPGHAAPEDDVLSQIGKLSPKAAEAIAAALGDGENG